MRIILIILTFLIPPQVFSQDWDLHDIILKIKPTDKNAIQAYEYVLTKYDSTERYHTGICAEACEAIADIYKSRCEYVKAIAYYDSLETKYTDRTQFCGNGVYGIRVVHKFKIAQCFVAMKDTLKALSVLAPYMFHYENDYYCGGEPADFYINLIKAAYTRGRLRNIIDSSLNSISYSYEPYELFSVGDTLKSVNCVIVTGNISLFNVKFELAHYYLTVESEAKVTEALRKDFFISTLKKTKIFKRMYQ